MTDTPRIEGLNDPRKSSQLSSDDSVDPEKFKRVLKVEKSDESQKQEKRKKPKKQEEEEETENKEVDKNIPQAGIFGALLKEPKDQDNIFGKETKKLRTSVSADDSLLPDSSYAIFTSEKKAQASKFTPSLNLTEVLPKASVPKKTQILKLAKNHLKKPKKLHVQAPILEKITSEPPEDISKTKKPAESVSIASEDLNLNPPKTSHALESELSHEPTKEIDSSKPKAEAAPEIPIEAPLPSVPIPLKEMEKSSENLSAIQDKNESLQVELDKKEKDEADEKEQVAPFVAEVAITTAPLLQAEAPVYSHLSPEVFELFEKMTGLLTIESHKGVSITTVKISMPNSVFHDSEIKIEHFDTAPHAFNIQLLGSPAAVDLFNANYQSLVASMAQSGQSFTAHIQRPVLLESYRHLIKRKSALSTDDPNQDQDPGEDVISF